MYAKLTGQGSCASAAIGLMMKASYGKLWHRERPRHLVILAVSVRFQQKLVNASRVPWGNDDALAWLYEPAQLTPRVKWVAGLSFERADLGVIATARSSFQSSPRGVPHSNSIGTGNKHSSACAGAHADRLCAVHPLSRRL